jgi:hypothetical protein
MMNGRCVALAIQTKSNNVTPLFLVGFRQALDYCHGCG